MPNTAWGMTRLAGECNKIKQAKPGERNVTLNTVAFKVYQAVPDHIEPDNAWRALYDAAMSLGTDRSFTEADIRATLNSARNGGRNHPVTPEPRPPRRLLFDPYGTLTADNATSTQAQGLTDAFWRARPVLGYIRQAAHSRGRSAEAVLGVVLARVAADTPHTVKLPPLVGARCGLSLIVALTGPPGTGKSSSKSIGVELVGRRIIAEECDDVPPGSGEGLVEILFEYEVDGDGNKRKVQKRHNVFVYIDEGEVLATQARRNSQNTIIPTLRSVFTDATLGQANASIERKRRVQGGRYVYGVVLGLQPSKAADLLGDAGGGTPQRFLWMPTNTPVPASKARPGWPGTIDELRADVPTVDRFHRSPMLTGGWSELHVPDDIAAEIMAADHKRQGEGCDPMDEHTDLVRLKVAGILAVVDGRPDINTEDWQLAEVIRDLSNTTRDRTRATVAATAAEANVARGAVEGTRQIARDEKVSEVGEQRAGRKIMNKLAKAPGDWVNRGKLTNACGKDAAYFDDTVTSLINAGQIESRSHLDPSVETEQYRRIDRGGVS